MPRHATPGCPPLGSVASSYEVELLTEEMPSPVHARGIRSEYPLDRVVAERGVGDLLAAVQCDVLASECLAHEFRDRALGEVSLAGVHVREAEDDGLDRAGERWVRIGAARSFGAQLRHAVDGEGRLRMGLVDREILRLPVHLAARGVEEHGARLRLPTCLEDVQRSELIRPPASVWVELPPGPRVFGYAHSATRIPFSIHVENVALT